MYIVSLEFHSPYEIFRLNCFKGVFQNLQLIKLNNVEYFKTPFGNSQFYSLRRLITKCNPHSRSFMMGLNLIWISNE